MAHKLIANAMQIAKIIIIKKNMRDRCIIFKKTAAPSTKINTRGIAYRAISFYILITIISTFYEFNKQPGTRSRIN